MITRRLTEQIGRPKLRLIPRRNNISLLSTKYIRNFFHIRVHSLGKKQSQRVLCKLDTPSRRNVNK